jgi:ribosomal protein S12 methylthiotransferase
MGLEATMSHRTIHFVSLGCPKNRVDSEVMLGVAERSGYHQVPEPAAAEVIVVNTCGFIDAAKQESIDTILELAQYKKTGACQSLVVTGCLSQRHPDELAAELPEVDYLLGSSDMLKLEHVLSGKAQRILVGSPADWVISSSDPRTLSTRGASAYVKLAEGCNRSCAFCVIPQLRGKQRSRPAADIVREVRQLAERGILEVNLISQDTTAYGRDRDAKTDLSQVVRRVADVKGIRWVRLHYLYPETLTKDLTELLTGHPQVLPYVDMPLQHASDSMLRRMKRGHGGKRLRNLVEQLRKRVDRLVFRTAFIVGHPGETEQDFAELLEFVAWAKFDRLGVFCYSDEPGTLSHEQAGKVPRRVAAARAKQLMMLQRQISRKKNRGLVGQELDVLVEGASEESDMVMVGRHAGQAPEIDGSVFLSGDVGRAGRIVKAKVRSATDYDLMAEVLDDGNAPEQGPTTRANPRRLRVV